MQMPGRGPLTWALVVIALLLVIFAGRRWVHHAQLESIPVIVPDDLSAGDVVHPPAGAIARRMLLDVRDAFSRPVRPRLAVLTFDDGPFPVTTPLLLAQLQGLNVPAVFFLIGNDSRQQPALAQRLAAEKMELGNHTLSHPELAGLPAGQQLAEIAGGKMEIRLVTGVKTRYFRPPHGNFDATTIDAARAQAQTVALWDVDPGDWRNISADVIIANVTQRARAPAVILMHNGKFATIEALPRIVAAYRAAGFTFVTLSELQRRLPLTAINDPVKVAL